VGEQAGSRRLTGEHNTAEQQGQAADDRTSPFPYAENFDEWVADEAAAPPEAPKGPVERAQAMAKTPHEHTEEELREYLHCWTLPGGRLTPDQTRALIAWDGTPETERAGLEADLASTQQQVPAEPLAPNQRRGHVSWLDRLKHFLGH
jgi:hypothetical protein